MNMSDELKQALKEHFSALGKKGGSAKGPRKARGDGAYYSSIAKRRWEKKQD
ncbi:MAG: hypothetical protein ACO204_00680 [Schleiferiaceae bacterium]